MFMNKGEELEKLYIEEGSLKGSSIGGGRDSQYNSGKLVGKMKYFGSTDNVKNSKKNDMIHKKSNKSVKSNRVSIIDEENELQEMISTIKGDGHYELLYIQK